MSLCRAALYTVFVVSSTAYATSVVEVTLEEMLQNSALVFEGQVTGVQVRESGNRDIQTLLTFEIIDVIKGEVQGSKITLGFLGGELAGRKLSVSAMQMPALHERGIYFVESPGRKQVQPLYGWSQGHLRLEQDPAGTERVFTSSGRPVKGVVQTNGKRSGLLSTGAARGLMVGTPDEVSAALGKKEFKRLLRAAQ
ncbi:MAG: hypothetical protein WBN81_03140 [Gammaproteobacteria bacterium]